MGRLFKVAMALLLPFALASCVLAPGKFVSTLRIDADHHFAFSYVGEVYAIDMSDSMKGLGDTPSEHATPASFQAGDSEDPAKKKAAADARNREIAAALTKEAGYRKVTYVGDGKFQIDYAVSGTLDHAFVFPYNLDAEAVFPFVIVELRANGTVRVKAPGFAADDNSKSVPGAGQQTSKLDGVFTLDTDAEIVSQNNEEGAKPGAGGRRTISWKATPLTKDAPTAVLRLH
jgi:hypothetical protein